MYTKNCIAIHPIYCPKQYICILPDQRGCIEGSFLRASLEDLPAKNKNNVMNIKQKSRENYNPKTVYM